MTDEQKQTREQLFERLEGGWIPRLVRGKGAVSKFVKASTDDSEDGDRRRYMIYTNDHSYAISAIVREDGHTYLGCVMSNRKPRAGESHTRGSDLPDGAFNHDTWFDIVHAIVGCELVPLASSQVSQPDEAEKMPDETAEKAAE